MISEAIVQIIAEICGQVIMTVVEYPGAYIHWLCQGKKASFNEIKEKYFGINLIISCVIYAVIMGIIIQIVK